MDFVTLYAGSIWPFSDIKMILSSCPKMASNLFDSSYGGNMKAKLKTKPARTDGARRENYYVIVPSPVGDLMLVADAAALKGVYFVGCKHLPAASKQWEPKAEHPILQSARKQLQEYFAGRRKIFSLPLSPIGTDFQTAVWKNIAVIPYGKTVSYSDLAQQAGQPEAIRAAGTSTGRNPISIIIPCHRVVGKNGGLHGFAGGLERKRQLLNLENPELELMAAKARH